MSRIVTGRQPIVGAQTKDGEIKSYKAQLVDTFIKSVNGWRDTGTAPELPLSISGAARAVNKNAPKNRSIPEDQIKRLETIEGILKQPYSKERLDEVYDAMKQKKAKGGSTGMNELLPSLPAIKAHVGLLRRAGTKGPPLVGEKTYLENMLDEHRPVLEGVRDTHGISKRAMRWKKGEGEMLSAEEMGKKPPTVAPIPLVAPAAGAAEAPSGSHPTSAAEPRSSQDSLFDFLDKTEAEKDKSAAAARDAVAHINTPPAVQDAERRALTLPPESPGALQRRLEADARLNAGAPAEGLSTPARTAAAPSGEGETHAPRTADREAARQSAAERVREHLGVNARAGVSAEGVATSSLPPRVAPSSILQRPGEPRSAPPDARRSALATGTPRATGLPRADNPGAAAGGKDTGLTPPGRSDGGSLSSTQGSDYANPVDKAPFPTLSPVSKEDMGDPEAFYAGQRRAIADIMASKGRPVPDVPDLIRNPDGVDGLKPNGIDLLKKIGREMSKHAKGYKGSEPYVIHEPGFKFTLPIQDTRGSHTTLTPEQRGYYEYIAEYTPQLVANAMFRTWRYSKNTVAANRARYDGSLPYIGKQINRGRVVRREPGAPPPGGPAPPAPADVGAGGGGGGEGEGGGGGGGVGGEGAAAPVGAPGGDRARALAGDRGLGVAPDTRGESTAPSVMPTPLDGGTPAKAPTATPYLAGKETHGPRMEAIQEERGGEAAAAAAHAAEKAASPKPSTPVPEDLLVDVIGATALGEHAHRGAETHKPSQAALDLHGLAYSESGIAENIARNAAELPRSLPRSANRVSPDRAMRDQPPHPEAALAGFQPDQAAETGTTAAAPAGAGPLGGGEGGGAANLGAARDLGPEFAAAGARAGAGAGGEDYTKPPGWTAGAGAAGARDADDRARRTPPKDAEGLGESKGGGEPMRAWSSERRRAERLGTPVDADAARRQQDLHARIENMGDRRERMDRERIAREDAAAAARGAGHEGYAVRDDGEGQEEKGGGHGGYIPGIHRGVYGAVGAWGAGHGAGGEDVGEDVVMGDAVDGGGGGRWGADDGDGYGGGGGGGGEERVDYRAELDRTQEYFGAIGNQLTRLVREMRQDHSRLPPAALDRYTAMSRAARSRFADTGMEATLGNVYSFVKDLPVELINAWMMHGEVPARLRRLAKEEKRRSTSNGWGAVGLYRRLDAKGIFEPGPNLQYPQLDDATMPGQKAHNPRPKAVDVIYDPVRFGKPAASVRGYFTPRESAFLVGGLPSNPSQYMHSRPPSELKGARPFAHARKKSFVQDSSFASSAYWASEARNPFMSRTTSVIEESRRRHPILCAPPPGERPPPLPEDDLRRDLVPSYKHQLFNEDDTEPKTLGQMPEPDIAGFYRRYGREPSQQEREMMVQALDDLSKARVRPYEDTRRAGMPAGDDEDDGYGPMGPLARQRRRGPPVPPDARDHSARPMPQQALGGLQMHRVGGDRTSHFDRYAYDYTSQLSVQPQMDPNNTSYSGVKRKRSYSYFGDDDGRDSDEERWVIQPDASMPRRVHWL